MNTVLSASLLALGLGASAQAADLFSEMAPKSLSPDALRSLDNLQSLATAGEVSLRSIDAESIHLETQSVTLNLSRAVRFPVTRLDAYTLESGSDVWTGSVRVVSDEAASNDGRIAAKAIDETLSVGPSGHDPMNEMVLIRDVAGITGNVRIQGDLYAIRPLGDGVHAFYKVHTRALPPDHPPEYARIQSAASKLPAAHDGSKAITTIRVMSVATPAAISAAGNISSLMDLAVAESNQSYQNSGVEIRLQTAGKYSISYTESGSFSTDLARIRGTSDGYMDSIHSTRNSQSADMVMFWINNSSACGLASAIGASASTAFAAVYWDCATGYYSYGHELGHLQSARHDPANDPSTSPYRYGHGYQYAPGGWRTVMAYNCSGGCTRINYWSNPGKTYGGAAMGTSSSSDNHRVLNNTRSRIAGFR